jgi:hypothetical protein
MDTFKRFDCMNSKRLNDSSFLDVFYLYNDGNLKKMKTLSL